MIKNFLFLSVLLFTLVGVAQQPVPQLPQTYIDTTYMPPTGVSRPVHSSTEFKDALNSASPGDTIVLDAGVTYQGNFTLPAKSNSNNKWIYIVGSALSSLPKPGTRVNPASDAAKMPKIVSTTVVSPLTLPPGANHYRLVGLEIFSASTQGCVPTSIPPQNCYSYQLVNANAAIGQPLIDSVTVDRCYLHGSPTQDVREGVAANGSNFAVVDSYISDIHQSQNDSQAIVAYYSPGPIKIVNNYLSATGEDVMFGGAGGLNNPWVPSDIEIRNNHFFKDPAWAAPGITLPPHNQWAVKNNLEFKSGRRALVDGNLMENSWVSGQNGYAIVLTPRTHQSGLTAVVDDITISNNILKNMVSGFDTIAWDDACLPSGGCTNVGEAKRIGVYNNLLLLRDPKLPGGANNFGIIVMFDLTDFVFQHNTIIPPPGASYCYQSIFFNSRGYPGTHSSTHNVWILDNILCRQPTGNGGGQGTAGLTNYMGDPAPLAPRFLGNVMYVPTVDRMQQFPPRNFSSVGRAANSDDNDYRLNYPAKMETTDGRVAGVDKSKLASAHAAETGIETPTRSGVSTQAPETRQ